MLLLRIVLLSWVFSNRFSSNNALVLSKSKVTMCENTGKNPYNVVDGKTCQKKLLVTMSVVSGQNNTEMVYANVSKIYDETSNEAARLYNPFTLTLSKSPVMLVYPYTYTGQTVNNKPTEKVKLLGKWYNPESRTDCNDKWGEKDEDDVSCKYAKKTKRSKITDKTKTKARIWDSQGFCCYCSERDKWRGSFGKSLPYTRGGITCGLAKNKQASAHCLEFDDLWYTVHEIGFWQMDFTITIQLYEQVTKVKNNQTKVELVNGGKILLGPKKRSGTGLYNRIIAHFIGEFRNTKQFPTLSERYLLIPEVTSDIDAKKHEQLKYGPSRYLIFPRDMVDIHSRACNKIGVSYSAFRNQATDGFGYGCRQKKGFCLYNQPRDFWRQDKKRLEQRKSPRYYAMRYGKMIGVKKQVGTKKFNLAYETSEMMTSMILLQLSADDIVLVYNRAKGIIARASVARFEALSGSGKMHVEVNNEGVVSAEFFVRVSACSDGVRGVHEKGGTVIPRHNKVFVFGITVFNRDASMYSCTVHLYDSARKLIDSKNVTFQTQEACVCLPGCDCKCSGKSESHHCTDRKEEGITVDGTSANKGFFHDIANIFKTFIAPITKVFGFLKGQSKIIAGILVLVCILVVIAMLARFATLLEMAGLTSCCKQSEDEGGSSGELRNRKKRKREPESSSSDSSLGSSESE